MISKKLLSLLIAGILLQGSLALGMENKPAKKLDCAFTCFSFQSHESPITKLTTGVYKGQPCIIALSANQVTLHPFGSNKTLTDYYISSGLKSGDIMLSRTMSVTNLNSGFIRLLFTNTNEVQYVNGIHYEVSYYDFENYTNKLGANSIGQTFPQIQGWLGLEYKDIKIMEPISDQCVAFGYENGSIKIFNLASEKLTTLGEHQGLTCITAVGKNKFVSGSSDGTIKIWKLGEVLCEQGNPIVSLLRLDKNILVVGEKTNDADISTPLQGCIFSWKKELSDTHFDFFGNVAKFNDKTIAYFENLETLTVVIHNLETQQKLIVQPFPHINNLKNCLFDTSKALLTTYCGRIIITAPGIDNNYYISVSEGIGL